MKLDAVFARQILLTLENYPDYLMSSLKLKDAMEISTKEMERKFMGHILLLADAKLLDYFPENKWPFGFVYGVDGEYSIIEVGYRLTAGAYELMDVCRNDDVFNKIKHLSINNALEISRQIIAKKTLGDRRRKS